MNTDQKYPQILQMTEIEGVEKAYRQGPKSYDFGYTGFS